MKLAGTMKLIIIVVVGLFILKIASAWLSKKFPNAVTSAVDTVVQTA